MSYRLLFIIPLILACGMSRENSSENSSNPISHHGPVEGTFRLAFYNVENLFDTQDDPAKKDEEFTPQGKKNWTSKRYHKKLDNISKVFEEMEVDGQLPAIIGLAEIENHAVLEDLSERLLELGTDYAIVHKDSKDMRGIDVALLYDRKRVNHLDEEFLRIDFAQRGFTSRDILYFKGQVGNEVIHVFVNHWPSRREGVNKTEHRRLDAARTVKDKIAEVGESPNVVIVGDFNDEPNDRSVTDILQAAQRPDKKNALNNLSYGLMKRGLGTSMYKGHWNMLDQCIVSGSLLDDKGLDVTAKGLQIFKEDFILYFDKKSGEGKPNRTYGRNYYGGYSDHLPIMLDLAFE